MQPRAFVIMPFHTKGDCSGLKINFDDVYSELLEPALKAAGYEVARADTAENAGDIRTDMFFELVTADLVVADVTILNPNVYYELGVRHGVCPRGIFMTRRHGASDCPRQLPGMSPECRGVAARRSDASAALVAE